MLVDWVCCSVVLIFHYEYVQYSHHLLFLQHSTERTVPNAFLANFEQATTRMPLFAKTAALVFIKMHTAKQLVFLACPENLVTMKESKNAKIVALIPTPTLLK